MDNNELLQQIISSEKKSKTRLVLAIIISLLLGTLTFYYATMLNKSKAQAVKSERLAQKLKADIQESRNDLITITDSLTTLLEKCEDQQTTKSAVVQGTIEKSKRTGYLIYIHDKTERGRTISSRIGKSLRERGFKVAGIEKSPGKYPNSVKYFHKEDLKMAREIQQLIKRSAGVRSNLQDIKLVPLLSMKAPREQIEIWLDL